MNPLSRLLAAIVGALVIVGAFMFGFFILVAAVALGLVAWLVIWLRVWWIKRKLGGAADASPLDFGQPPEAKRPGPGSGDVIDAEYEVVSRTERSDQEKDRNG
jgi:hypothetical protein